MTETRGEISERLKAARVHAGFGTATEASRALLCPSSTYLSYENGSRGIDVSRAMELATFYSVRWEWLLAGEGEMVGRVAEGVAMTATPDPAAFADALSEAVRDAGSAGLVHVNRDQVVPNTQVGGDLVVPAQHEIEVYENSAGAVVIKMDAGNVYDDDQVVIIRPEHVDAVVAAMLRVKAEAQR